MALRSPTADQRLGRQPRRWVLVVGADGARGASHGFLVAGSTGTGRFDDAYRGFVGWWPTISRVDRQRGAY